MELLIKTLQELKHCESHIFNQCDEGGAEVWCLNNRLFLFEIPQFGGEPRYLGTWLKTSVRELIEMAESWT